MLRKFRVLILPALAALAWNITPAYSTTLTTYTSLASWQAATSGGTTDTFEGLTPSLGSTPCTGPNGLTYDPNVDFLGYSSSASSDIQVVDTAASAWYNFGTGDALLQSMDRPNSGSPLPYIHVVFLAPVTAFAADLFTSSPSGLSYAVTVYGASNTQLATPYTAATNALPNTAFWGVTSDTPIWSVDLTLQGTAFNGGSLAFLDNFRYGTAQAQGPPPDVPEAATLVMIGSGLIGLAYMRKRIKPTQPV